MPLKIHQIPVKTDNYIYILHCERSHYTAVVDPTFAEPVASYIESQNWSLDAILNTHHHHDHIGGNLELMQRFDCVVYGSAKDAARIPGITHHLHEGDAIDVGDYKAQVMEVFGHTIGHIAFHFNKEKALFCGDTLFSIGCGRLFEGEPATMWASLNKLRALEADTRVYCAHEYTLHNSNFALSQDPQNQDLIKYAQRVASLRHEGRPTIPTTIGTEIKCNPFLRADQGDLQKALKMQDSDPVEVFAELRRRRNDY